MPLPDTQEVQQLDLPALLQRRHSPRNRIFVARFCMARVKVVSTNMLRRPAPTPYRNRQTNPPQTPRTASSNGVACRGIRSRVAAVRAPTRAAATTIMVRRQARAPSAPAFAPQPDFCRPILYGTGQGRINKHAKKTRAHSIQEQTDQPIPDAEDGIVKRRGMPRHPVKSGSRKGTDQSGGDHNYGQATSRDARPDRRVVHKLGRAENPRHPIDNIGPLVGNELVALPAMPSGVIQCKGRVVVNLDHLSDRSCLMKCAPLFEEACHLTREIDVRYPLLARVPRPDKVR